MKYLTNLDLNKNELQNVRIQNLATAPENPVEGQIYYNTTDKVMYQWDGEAWKPVGGGFPIMHTNNVGGFTLTDPKTGYEVMFETSSDGKELVYYVDGLPEQMDPINLASIDYVADALADYLKLAGGTMTGDVNMGGNSITGLPEPSETSDATTKGYVDRVAVGALKPSGSCLFADLPELGATFLNHMYSITEEFTATEDFLEEEVGKTYPAGTNVAIINIGTSSNPVYKYDAMTGVIDTSGFATKDDVNGLITTAQDTIGTEATSVSVAYTGTILDIIATQNGEKVIVDTNVSDSAVTFSCAAAPSAEIVCKVVAAGTLS